MDNQVVSDLVSKTAGVVIKNTSEIVFDRIEKAKAKKDDKQTIVELEEIINNLLNDKNQLQSIIQQYEEILAIQKISDDDIEYISENIIPILTEVLQSDAITQFDEEEVKSINEVLEILEPLLSIETFKILQLLGFNFREAIGLPLTNLVKKSINKNEVIELQYENNIASNKAQEQLFKLLQTEEGRQAFEKINIKYGNWLK